MWGERYRHRIDTTTDPPRRRADGASTSAARHRTQGVRSQWDDLDLDHLYGDVVAVGDDLSARTLLGAYRSGCFPWPTPGWPATPWCSPDPRAVLPVEALHLGRTLRARLRRCGWETTVDHAFSDVVDFCADRPETWITPVMRAAYTALHAAGAAHSVEVWAGDRLVGGLYGVQVGAVFSGESMFSRADDAGKAAVADLVTRLASAGGRLLDCQQATPHLTRLGAVLVPRATFVAAVRRLRDEPVTLERTRLPVARLVARASGSGEVTSPARAAAAPGRRRLRPPHG